METFLSYPEILTDLAEGYPQQPVAGLTEEVGQEDEQGEAEVGQGEGEDEPVGPVLPQDTSLTHQTQDNTEQGRTSVRK